MPRHQEQLTALVRLRAELICSLNSLNHHAPLQGRRGEINLRIASEHIHLAIGELTNRIDVLKKGKSGVG